MNQFGVETKKRRAYFRRELSLRKKRSQRFTRAYQSIADLIGDPLSWPETICAVRENGVRRRHTDQKEDFRRLFISENLKHGERFKLTLFLLGNGVPPNLIEEFYASNNSLRDESASRSVASMISQYKSLSEETRNKWASFDLIRMRWEYFNGKVLTKPK